MQNIAEHCLARSHSHLDEFIKNSYSTGSQVDMHGVNW